MNRWLPVFVVAGALIAVRIYARFNPEGQQFSHMAGGLISVAVAIYIAYTAIREIRTGSIAGPKGGATIRRSENPSAFWSAQALSLLLTTGALWAAIHLLTM